MGICSFFPTIYIFHLLHWFVLSKILDREIYFLYIKVALLLTHVREAIKNKNKNNTSYQVLEVIFS